jgi:hypothetical protein
LKRKTPRPHRRQPSRLIKTHLSNKET